MPVVNDQMVRPKFMAKAALFHIKETKHVVQDAEPVTLHVDLVRSDHERENHARAGLSVSHPLPGAYPDAYRQTIDRYYPREGALWEVGPQDVRISRQTLEYRAQIAEQMQRHAVARNFRRAAELIAIPDERILAIYNALRPFRSSQAELLAIADELEHTGMRQ